MVRIHELKLAGFRFKVGINGDDQKSFSEVEFGASQDHATIRITRALQVDDEFLYMLMRRNEPVEITVNPENEDGTRAGVDIVCRMAKPVAYNVAGVCAWKDTPITESVHLEFLEFTAEDWEVVFAAKGERR